MTGDGLLMAFMAGDLFIVLPTSQRGARRCSASGTDIDSEARDLPDVIVPASFNLPHAGKLLSISFILFAGWFADAPIPLAQYPAAGRDRILTFFGSLNAAVPFLLDMFRIPSDTFQLFVATSVINSRSARWPPPCTRWSSRSSAAARSAAPCESTALVCCDTW